MIGDGRAAHGLNLSHHGICARLAMRIVGNDNGPVLRQPQRNLPPDAPARAGDQCGCCRDRKSGADAHIKGSRDIGKPEPAGVVAAALPATGPDLGASVNVLGTVRVAEAARRIASSFSIRRGLASIAV